MNSGYSFQSHGVCKACHITLSLSCDMRFEGHFLNSLLSFVAITDLHSSLKAALLHRNFQ